MRRIILFALLSLLFSAPIRADINDDVNESLSTGINYIGEENYDSLEVLIESLSDKIGRCNEETQAFYSFEKGTVLQHKEKYSEAISLYLKAKEYFDANFDSENATYFDLCNYLAICYLYKGDIDTAEKTYRSALVMGLSAADTYDVFSDIIAGLADIYTYKADTVAAKEAYVALIQFYVSKGREEADLQTKKEVAKQIMAANQQGVQLINEGKYLDALAIYAQIIYPASVFGLQDILEFSFHNIGKCLCGLKDYKKAYLFLEQSSKLQMQLNGRVDEKTLNLMKLCEQNA